MPIDGPLALTSKLCSFRYSISDGRYHSKKALRHSHNDGSPSVQSGVKRGVSLYTLRVQMWYKIWLLV